MSSILTHAIITDAKTQVDAYITQATALKDQLDSIMNTLTANNFVGDASDGFRVFYTERIVPAISDNLTGTQSLAASIKGMLDGVQETLLDTVDPQLGENNANPGA